MPSVDLALESYDALDYLPRRSPATFKHGAVIYNPSHPPDGLYLILEGRVKCFSHAAGSWVVTVGLYGPNEFCGEESVLRGTTGFEQPTTAKVLTDTTVMQWPVEEMFSLMNRHPQLALALLRVLVNRSVLLTARMQSMANDTIALRIVKALLQLGAANGVRRQDGWVQMQAHSHQLLAEYIGTSREMVTHEMSQLRRSGLVDYTRKELRFRPELLAQGVA